MARDIEEFLRKAAERRAAQQQGQRPGSQPPPAQPSPPRQAPAQQRPPEITRPVMQPRTTGEIQDEPDPFPSGQSVAQHVQKHIDSGASEISQIARKLGERVGQSGKKVNERVQQKFEHEVGNLADSQGRGESKKKQPTEGRLRPAATVITSQTIADMFRSPPALRQAIIVAELLKRPEWD